MYVMVLDLLASNLKQDAQVASDFDLSGEIWIGTPVRGVMGAADLQYARETG